MFSVVPYSDKSIDKIFEKFFGDPFDFTWSFPLTTKYEVTEDDNQKTFKLEVAGVDKENIEITAKDKYLLINIKREEKKEKPKYSTFKQESESYSLCVGKTFDPDKIVASCDKGILTITVPYEAPKLPEQKKISIQ